MIHDLIRWIMRVTVRSVKESETSLCSPMMVINAVLGGMSFIFFLTALILFGDCQWGKGNWEEFYRSAIMLAGSLFTWAAATWVVETYLNVKKEYGKNNEQQG